MTNINEILKIENKTINNELIKTVNARTLHYFLEIGKDFSNWIKDRLQDFIENQDFIVFAEIGEKGGRPKIEYFLTLDTAKHISMIERNEKGKQARQYFIECEKAYRLNPLINPQTNKLNPTQNTPQIQTQAETTKHIFLLDPILFGKNYKLEYYLTKENMLFFDVESLMCILQLEIREFNKILREKHIVQDGIGVDDTIKICVDFFNLLDFLKNETKYKMKYLLYNYDKIYETIKEYTINKKDNGDLLINNSIEKLYSSDEIVQMLNISNFRFGKLIDKLNIQNNEQYSVFSKEISKNGKEKQFYKYKQKAVDEMTKYLKTEEEYKTYVCSKYNL